jgi:NhaA family Na+:H+ antiporter
VNRLAFYLLPGIVMWYFMHLSGVHATISGVMLAFAIPFGKHDHKNISYQLQHWLHKPVAFIVLPLFAFANTAIFLAPGWYNELGQSNSLGIISGLVIGKPLGILIFCWLLTMKNWGKLPRGIKWKHIAGAGMLGGIGFTMSIFVSNLAFADSALIQTSKVSVLVASLIATIVGLGFLLLSNKATKPSD